MRQRGPRAFPEVGTTKPKAKPAKKAAQKSTAKSTGLRPQPHGGALRNGGTNAGNPNAPGRPASAIREHCRGSFGERVRVLESIADGEPMQRVEVPLGVVLRSATCPKCGEGLKAEDADALLVTVEGKASASPGDRIKAVDTLGKYGLDARTQLAVEEVRDRLVRQLTVIRQALSPEVAETLIEKLREVWKT